MQTKTFLAFYHHAEVKRKESPDVDRPEGVEKFVYNEKIFKEEPPSSGTPTLFTHSVHIALESALIKENFL